MLLVDGTGDTPLHKCVFALADVLGNFGESSLGRIEMRTREDGRV